MLAHAWRSCAFAAGERRGFASASDRRPARGVGRWRHRRRPTRVDVAAILRPDLPQPPREPTWQDRLGNLKEHGPNAGPVGRKNRGPRRVIKPHIKQPRGADATHSVDAQIRAFEDAARRRKDAAARGTTLGAASSNAVGRAGAGPAGSSSSTTSDPASSPRSRARQRAETASYSFLGQSSVRYPSADLADPDAARATYRDSDVDKLAIAVASRALADAAGAPLETLGSDPGDYATLANAARALRDAAGGPARARDAAAEIMRAQIRAGIPPLPFLDADAAVLPTLAGFVPADVRREMNAAVASEAAEWMFGPTSRETMAGPNGRPVTVVSVKKCRYLEATRCSGVCVNMCKLPAQDVVRSEFGVPLYVAPNHADGSCRMFFGQEPLPEQIDPALKSPCARGCDAADRFNAADARALQRAETDERGFPVANAWVETKATVDDKCGALPARTRA